MPESNGHEGDDGYSIRRERVLTKLDPELQRIILSLRQGQGADPTLREELIDGTVMVDVVAKLQNPGTPVRGLTAVQKIGQVVTGLLEADMIEEARRDPNVISLKAARKLRRMLSNSVPEVRATRRQILADIAEDFPGDFPDGLPGNFDSVDGTGVIVGIVDHGCDFAHPHFRKPDGRTRILHLWDQRGGFTEASPDEYGYGREFGEDDINEALLLHPPTPGNPAAPHDFLGYRIRGRPHGTRVMDIAAGNGNGVNPPGVAPGADIIFVDASLGDELESGESFGNSRHLLEAVKYIFDKANRLGKRAVVNISLNYDAGPHDGSTPVEEGFDLLLEEVPGRAIVIAAGNSRDKRRHARKTIHARRPGTIRWEIPENDRTSNKMELWYTGRRKVELTLRSPREQQLGPFPLGSTFTIFRNGERAGQVFHRCRDSANHDNHIVLVFTTLMEPGVWTLTLNPLGSELFAPFDAHAWIETDDIASSTFVEADISYTVGAVSCGYSVIAVGSYDVLDPRRPESASSAGPTRDGRQKPEVSAPGGNVRAASALTASVGSDGGGTSNAAPHVTGLIALLMQKSPRALTIEETRALVINSARPLSNERMWDPIYGIGRADAARSMVALRDDIGPPKVNVEHHDPFSEESIELLFESEGVSAHTLGTEGVITSVSVEFSTAGFMVAPASANTNGSAGEAPEDSFAADEHPQTPVRTKGH